MGMAKKLAFKDTPTPVSTGALQELQTSESVFTVFVNLNRFCWISASQEALLHFRTFRSLKFSDSIFFGFRALRPTFYRL